MDEPSAFDKVVGGIKDVADIVGDVNNRIKGGSNVESQIQQLSELTQKMLANSLAMVQLESALRDKARMFEERLKKVENWEKEKERYELKSLPPRNAFVYVLKTPSEMPGTEYQLCSSCFENGKKSILQPQVERMHVLYCPECNLTIPLV